MSAALAQQSMAQRLTAEIGQHIGHERDLPRRCRACEVSLATEWTANNTDHPHAEVKSAVISHLESLGEDNTS